MGRELWASLATVVVLAACSLPSLEGAEDDADGVAAGRTPATASGSGATVVEDALLVAGETSIAVHPRADDPFEIVTGEPVTAIFEDGAGGLIYATALSGDRRAVRHLPAGSDEGYTLVDDLTTVYDLGIVRGLPAVIGARQASPTGPATVVAVQLTGEEDRLLELPATAVSVDQGGARIVLGHVDAGTSPVCTWFEVRDMSGEALPPPPGLSDEPTCEEGVDELPVTSLSTDGRRFAVTATGDEGSTSIRIIDLDLGGEQVVIVPDVRSLDLGLTGGLIISQAGVVQLAADGQTWLRPFPPGTDASSTMQVVHSPLRLAAALAEGGSVALTDAEPPGVVFLAGEVLIGPGSAGETVLGWQRQLNRWLSVSDLEDRELLEVTGVYDVATQALTEDFVVSAGLNDDGTIDERDLDELTRRIAVLENGPGIIQNGDGGVIVARWQVQLARWIELADPEDLRRSVRPDGVFGDGTEDATLVFEAAVGNRQDGVVQPADRAAMEQALIDLAAGAPADGDDDADGDDG